MSMVGALDHTANDALHSFHDALQRAQGALQQEETRLAQLAQTVRQQQESNQSRRDVIRSQQEPRLEALRREVMRVRSLAARWKDEVEAQQRHVESVRRPRLEVEAQLDAHRAALRQLQREYLTDSTAAHARLAEWWLPQNSLAALEERAARGAALVAALRVDVEASRARLEAEALRGREREVGESGEEGREGAADDDNAPEFFARRVARQREEREEFERQAADVIARRRAEVEQLKAALKGLCTDVEAADAAQQTAQQEFNAALNQQSDARVGCSVCGRDILGSFVA